MKTSASLLTGAASLALLVFTAQAATIHVPDDQPTIQAGLDAASAGDTVLVACGTYYEHDIVMESGVCLRSETGEADCVTVDAQQQGRVVFCNGVGGTTCIVGLTITGGSATNGGGVCCQVPSLSIANCTLSGNEAAVGGGIDSFGNSVLTITDCTFSGNQAGSLGAGVYCVLSSVSLESCTFSSNVTATSGSGGGMCLESCPTVTLSGCSFAGNQSQMGMGGGLNLDDCPTVTLSDCSFAGNQSNCGGGIHCENDASPVLTSCLFSDNTAALGGGLLCLESSCALTDCCLTGNYASNGGGGLQCEDADLTLTGCTLAHNQGSGWVGGGTILIGDGNSVALTNCIVAFGAEGEAVNCWDPASTNILALACCDIYGNAGGDWSGCIADQYGVNGNFSEDPFFCLDDDPGEPYALHEGSPCLPENSPCGELVGAFGLGCGPVSLVEETSWGAVKAMFR